MSGAARRRAGRRAPGRVAGVAAARLHAGARVSPRRCAATAVALDVALRHAASVRPAAGDEPRLATGRVPRAVDDLLAALRRKPPRGDLVVGDAGHACDVVAMV